MHGKRTSIANTENICFVCSGSKNYDKKKCYEMALAIEPEDHDYWHALGVCGGGTVGGQLSS